MLNNYNFILYDVFSNMWKSLNYKADILEVINDDIIIIDQMLFPISVFAYCAGIMNYE